MLGGLLADGEQGPPDHRFAEIIGLARVGDAELQAVGRGRESRVGPEADLAF